MKAIYAAGKPRWSLLSYDVLSDVVTALEEGAERSGARDYLVRPPSEAPEELWFDAAMRHLTAWRRGEAIDPTSNVPHLARAIANLLILEEVRRHRSRS